MSDKKDVLEFPLEELEVPQAIALMMQAATAKPTISVFVDPNGYEARYQVDEERLSELCEKLEAYVQDKIELAATIRTEPAIEDAPNDVYEDALVEDTHLVKSVDGDVYQVVNRGVLFQKACNALVYSGETVSGPRQTFCIKQYDHQSPIHEDMFGNESPPDRGDK